MPPLYRVRDWDQHFENNRTRELKRMDWLPVPNRHDGDGFTELLDHPNGMAHYAAWHLLLQVASKCHPRGTLVREVTRPQDAAADPGGRPHPAAAGGKLPHDARSLARITHGSEAVFLEAIPRLLSIGWLEVCTASGQSAAPACASVPMERNGTEEHTHSEAPRANPAAQARSAPPQRERVLEPKPKFQVDPTYQWLEQELTGFYHRPGGLTDGAEQSMAALIARRPAVQAEWALIAEYRNRMPPKDQRFFPQSLGRLLEKWDEQLDRARGAQAHPAERSLAEKNFLAVCEAATKGL
jgi:hypothetical protein